MIRLGVDVVLIKRFRQLSPKNFYARFLTAQEMDYCKQHALPAQWVAGRWALKEAIFKTGYFTKRVFAWKNIMITYDQSGSLLVYVWRSDKAIFTPEEQLAISVSHNQEQVVAVAAWSPIK